MNITNLLLATSAIAMHARRYDGPRETRAEAKARWKAEAEASTWTQGKHPKKKRNVKGKSR